MKVNNIQSCHLGPEISPENYIPENYFLYLLKGDMKAYDGEKNYSMKPGEYCIARKNHLVRYTKYKDNDEFEKIIITLDEEFLKRFLERHVYEIRPSAIGDSFIFIPENRFIKNFITSLEPYYTGDLEISADFVDVKREELLIILLKSNPDLIHILFNFSLPNRINLKEYMNKNFRFNISLEKFAFFTGRSLSTFKRDFQRVFGMAPGTWLKRKRLQEAYFQIAEQSRKPSDVYLEVGFEDLSHFSFAFKKEFGKTPNEVAKPVSNGI